MAILISRRSALLAFGLVGAAVIARVQSARARSMDTRGLEPFQRALLDPELAQLLAHGKPAFDIDDDGAAGQNSGGLAYIEMQGVGLELLRHGLASGDKALVELGWKALDWGLRQQRPDGSFGDKGDFHSTSIYLAQLGASLASDPSRATDARLDGFSRGIDWMSRPLNESLGVRRNLGFCHRFWLIASMYATAARVLDQPELVRRGVAFALQGARLQTADGVNLERGGFDAGYQMIGVAFGARYALLETEATGRGAALGMLSRAMDREAQMVGPDGDVSIEGSTRMGKEIGFANRPKKLSRISVAEGFFLGWKATGDAKYRSLFRLVGRL